MYTVKNRKTKEVFTAKIIQKSIIKDEENTNLLKDICQEIKILKTLDSLYTVKFHGVYES